MPLISLHEIGDFFGPWENKDQKKNRIWKIFTQFLWNQFCDFFLKDD